MKKIEVFDGDKLHKTCPPNRSADALCRVTGTDGGGARAEISLSNEIFSRHLMFLGGIGTGKTNALFQIVKQLRERSTSDDVMIIFDTKGDFYNEFYRPGDVVISNDRKATGPGGADFWNIFNEIEAGEHTEENIVEIAKTLFHEKIENSSQPFFPNAAKDLFSAILLHAARTGEYKTNHALRELLDGASVPEIQSILARHSDLKAMTSYISDSKSPQTQGVISELQQLTREIFIGNFKKKGTLSMRRLVRAKGGGIVFIEYDLGIGNMLTPIYRLLFDMAIKEALSRQKSDGNVRFVADEFRLLPHLQHIDDAVNFGRSLGVKFIIGIQNVEQIYEAYGETRARSILSGFMTSVVFRVNDSASRKYAQELFGKNRKMEVYSSSIQSRGIVEQVRDANVVEDWDMTRLALGEAVVGLPSEAPFVFRFNEYIGKEV
jgi:type IV secretory pathway TraG/TraD family ATPase VirD4